ncbi:hypothetical protein Hanom_Chr14g01318341 [Helianthus anomalus]
MNTKISHHSPEISTIIIILPKPDFSDKTPLPHPLAPPPPPPPATTLSHQHHHITGVINHSKNPNLMMDLLLDLPPSLCPKPPRLHQTLHTLSLSLSLSLSCSIPT